MKERITLIASAVDKSGNDVHMIENVSQERKDQLARNTADSFVNVLNRILDKQKDERWNLVVSVEKAEHMED